LGNVKTGVTLFTTKIVNDSELAHCPEVGVKIYVVVVVLLTIAGIHVPVIPLVDVVDNSGAMPFLQIAGNVASNSGSIFGFTTTAAVLWVRVTTPHASVAITEYMPEFDTVELVITGFSSVEVYPFGPVQLKV
jgi:hypothetical protein